ALSADRRARQQGTPGTGLFAGIDRIAVAGTVPVGQPAGKLYTLTVKAFDRNGQKVFGNFGVVYNVDDGNVFIAAQSFFRGTFSYSVPAGNYQVSALISNADASYAFVTAPQVEVRSNNTIVVLDARKTNPVGATVPDPTSAVLADLATIGATYHSSSPGRGELDGRMAVAPWQSGVGLALSRLAAPLTRTEYVFTPADARWLQMVVVNEQEFAGFTSGDWRALP